MKLILVALALIGLGAGGAFAHEGRIVNLKLAPPDHQVKTLLYCGGKYEVKLGDGSSRQFKEFDLRFKTDSGPNGPKPGTPVMVRAGMAADRAFVVFAAPKEMTASLKETC